jgi:hypothetical protein
VLLDLTVKNPKSVYNELTLWTVLLRKLYLWFVFVISRMWVSIQNAAEDTRLELFPDTQVLIFPLIHIGRHGSIKHSMLRSMASLRWVVLLQVDNAWSTSVAKWREIVALRREKCMGLQVFLLRFCYDGFWCAFETRLEYFDEYQPEIKFKTNLYLCAVERPLQRCQLTLFW